jgi:hypothetical protein
MHSRLPIIVTILLLTISLQGFSQCMMAPLSLNQRAVNSTTIVLCKLKHSASYISTNNKIFTSNIVEVKAYLKGHTNHKEIIIISEGGEVDDRAEVVHPALELDPHHEIILMLKGDNTTIDNKFFRLSYPNTPQMEAYACSQGKLTYEDGLFHDLLTEKPMPENEMFAKINHISGESFLTPEGKIYQPRYYTSKYHSSHSPIKPGNAKVTAITSASPNPGIGGTINASDQITISGSGFGAAAGTVEFRNADDGGGTYIQSPVPASDIISWSDASIVMKVPRRAGTNVTDGIRVNGTFTFGYTVTYAHIEINSATAGFGGVSTRQRAYLVDKDGSGGYTFQYSTGFAANASAVAAFERALATWRCNTFVNFSVDKTTTTAITVAALDGINVISYDLTLPAGVLGRATSQFAGFSSAGCQLQNTTRFTTEIDVQFQDPPTGGYTWNYGPGASVAFATTYDFESVALHELGHAHGLGHIIATGKVMNYALFNGADARVLNAASDIAGGVSKLAYSTVAANYCIQYPPGMVGPMTLLSAGTCALPASLLYFTGKKISPDQNLIEWGTGVEINNKGFELYRSSDGINFELIGFIDAKGTGKGIYSFYDHFDAKQNLTYYKLIQVDFDGHTANSPIIIIESIESNHAMLYFEPGDKIIYATLSKAVESDTEWILYNTTGQIVAKDKITKGSNKGAHNASSLNSGVYYYQISGTGINLKGKIMLQQAW